MYKLQFFSRSVREIETNHKEWGYDGSMSADRNPLSYDDKMYVLPEYAMRMNCIAGEVMVIVSYTLANEREIKEAVTFEYDPN